MFMPVSNMVNKYIKTMISYLVIWYLNRLYFICLWSPNFVNKPMFAKIKIVWR